MEPNMQNKSEDKMMELDKKIDLIYISVEKTRKYFFWTMVITIALFVLPLIGLFFAIPSFLGSYTDSINTLGI